jgi:hypothetical protein
MDCTATGAQLVEELRRRFALIDTGPGRDGRQATHYALQRGLVGVHVTYADGVEAPALLADVSTDGARLLTDHFPEREETVRMYFDLGDRGLVLNGTVQHIGCERKERYFGVKFTNGAVNREDGRPSSHPVALPLWPIQSATRHKSR